MVLVQCFEKNSEISSTSAGERSVMDGLPMLTMGSQLEVVVLTRWALLQKLWERAQLSGHFIPSPDIGLNYKPRIFKVVMQVMWCINSYLVKTSVKKTRVPILFLQLLILYHQITPSSLTCCSRCFSDLLILFPDTLLYLVKNSPRLNLKNLPPF